ncbi:sulfatase-like hydrolase/transferase [Aquibacillus albus]|uniref:Arylsulfatase A-like enzyme n=1 Tax=Aquibacillus albus TaxID=1168171 RepID=A0ABS2MWZ3_9BACI|nr:sulfatase-like hydrolase/transferase [Aquibacillus albus]MBM7570376.1 arylsulfatase A-like enzyme [Aquibacillus albus]
MKQKNPNILLILADDLGFSDLGSFGGEINTPNLDQLANDGLRFTQYYNSARCCPSRASLLSGLYPHQADVGEMTADLETPGYRGYLKDQCVTLAEVLKEDGYHTYLSGKWHVGEKGPIERGFDEFYGILGG